MKYRVALTFIFVFALSFWVLTRNIDKPFIGIHDHNGARLGNIAKNYLKYGWETRLGQVEQKNTDGSFDYYTHYPFLATLSIAVSYKILGVSEAATRIVPALATSFTLALFFLIGLFLWGWKVGLLASFLALATPMVRYFGKNPVHEPFVTFFATLVFLGLALLIKNKWRKISLALIFGGSLLSALSGWGGYFVIPAVVLIFWKLGLKRHLVLYLSLMLTLFLGHFIFVRYLTGSFVGGGLDSIFLYRSGHTIGEVGVFQLLLQLRLWAGSLFTNTLLLLAAVWIFFLVKYRQHWELLLGMFAFGSIYPLVFSNAAYLHNYFIFGLLPFLAICGSLTIFKLLQKIKRPFSVLLPIGILLLVFFEKQTFLNTLEMSHTEGLAYKIGLDIKEKTKESDVILVAPQTFFFSRKPFLSYYGERTIVVDPSNHNYTWELLVNEPEGSFILQKVQ